MIDYLINCSSYLFRNGPKLKKKLILLFIMLYILENNLVVVVTNK